MSRAARVWFGVGDRIAANEEAYDDAEPCTLFGLWCSG
jgi:hypothetical protein